MTQYNEVCGKEADDKQNGYELIQVMVLAMLLQRSWLVIAQKMGD